MLATSRICLPTLELTSQLALSISEPATRAARPWKTGKRAKTQQTQSRLMVLAISLSLALASCSTVRPFSQWNLRNVSQAEPKQRK